jgi:tRNA1Val (adenine37-N6)-methyltransferase
MTLTLDPHELSDDALTDRVRVLQRRAGHRYSVDDVATAWVALRAASPEAQSCLDLGCGLGSVLLMVADRLPQVRAVGIEAQAMSYALAERNIERNALKKRVSVQFGDLRDPALLDRILQAEVAFGRESGFAVVTGTPPYKPLGSASVSPDPQRAHARVELRGGVEAYLSAASRVLASDGCFVMCAESALEERVAAGARAARLRSIYRVDVMPMLERKGRLFAVHCFVPERAEDGGDAAVARLLASRFGPEGQPSAHERLVLRDEAGARTEAARALRAYFGMASDPHEAPSPPRRDDALSARRPEHSELA